MAFRILCDPVNGRSCRLMVHPDRSIADVVDYLRDQCRNREWTVGEPSLMDETSQCPCYYVMVLGPSNGGFREAFNDDPEIKWVD